MYSAIQAARSSLINPAHQWPINMLNLIDITVE